MSSQLRNSTFSWSLLREYSSSLSSLIQVLCTTSTLILLNNYLIIINPSSFSIKIPKIELVDPPPKTINVFTPSTLYKDSLYFYMEIPYNLKL